MRVIGAHNELRSANGGGNRATALRFLTTKEHDRSLRVHAMVRRYLVADSLLTSRMAAGSGGLSGRIIASLPLSSTGTRL